jgi:hypothetical protein
VRRKKSQHAWLRLSESVAGQQIASGGTDLGNQLNKIKTKIAD